MFALLRERVFIIAEIANAHEGTPSFAADLIRASARSGADAVKFQLFAPDELAVPSFANYELYRRLQISAHDWGVLVNQAHEAGLQVFADVFGLESARLAQSLGVDGLKIHAADNANTALLRHVAGYGLPLLLSTGGSTWIEIAEALSVLHEAGIAAPIMLLHGFQNYPTQLSDSMLRRIRQLREHFGLPVGFASHADGGSEEALYLPAWGAAAGADLLEVHITLDRSQQGLDYFSSLGPEAFARMVALVRALEPALGTPDLALTESEQRYRNGHRKQTVLTRDIQAGEVLTPDALALKRVNHPPTECPPAPEHAAGHAALNFIPAHAPLQRKDLRLKVVATLACRLESSRLYGKPLQLVGDKPILQHLIDRLRQATYIDDVVLAISEGAGQCVFADYARQHGLPYIIGPEKDVLQRLIMAGEHAQADIVVRSTTENPFIYWQNIDEMIALHIENNADLTVTEKLPIGALAEVLSLDALKRSHKYGEDRHRSELCSLFIAENPESFTIQRITPPEKLQRPDIRLTVDTPYDLLLVRTLWDELHHDDQLLSIEEIINFWDAHPEIATINAREKSLCIWK